MKKVLVTGAAGFIGSHVVEELLKENVEVRALVRPDEDVKEYRGTGIHANRRLTGEGRKVVQGRSACVC